MWLRFKSLGLIGGGVLLMLPVAGPVQGGTVGQDCLEFVRGDNDNNLFVDSNDVIDHLGYVLAGGSGGVPVCLQTADANDNGLVTIGDTLATQRYVNLLTPETRLPLPSCDPNDAPGIPCVPGPDPTPGLVTVSDTPDPRFEFSIGDALGFPEEQGVHVPMTFSSDVPYYGFQVAFEYDALEIQVSNIFFDDTVVEGNDYVYAHAENTAVGAFAVVATLVDLFSPFSGGTLPAGQDQFVADVVFTVASTASPGPKTISFVNGRKIPDHPDPTVLPGIENLVILETEEFRPLVNSGVFTVSPGFVRGDVNNRGRVDIADAIYLLIHIFLGGDAPPCQQAGDANNDDRIDIADAIYILSYLFLGSAEPSEPFPNKGPAIPGRFLGCDP